MPPPPEPTPPRCRPDTDLSHLAKCSRLASKLTRRCSFHCTHRHIHTKGRMGWPADTAAFCRAARLTVSSCLPEHSARPLRRLAEWSGATTINSSAGYGVFWSIPAPATSQGGGKIASSICAAALQSSPNCFAKKRNDNSSPHPASSRRAVPG